MKQGQKATTEEELVQNLQDAGCKAEQVKQFLALRDVGDRKGQMKLLRGQRDCLLDEVHVGQKKIDCLDYLVYQMEKGNY